MSIINYTTPTIPLVVEGIDLTQNLDVYVTLEQGRYELTKQGNDLTITAETHDQVTDTSIAFRLTQDESSKFNFKGAVRIQVNWINQSGIRDATEIETVDVMENLLDKVINYGD